VLPVFVYVSAKMVKEKAGDRDIKFNVAYRQCRFLSENIEAGFHKIECIGLKTFLVNLSSIVSTNVTSKDTNIFL